MRAATGRGFPDFGGNGPAPFPKPALPRYGAPMQMSNDQALGLVRQGAEALQRGQAGEARDCLLRVTATGRANSQIWMLLAAAERALGNLSAQEAALDQALALDPGLVMAKVQKGDCRAAAGDNRAALAFYESALGLAEGHQPPPEIAAELSRVAGVVAAWRDRVGAAREAALASAGLPEGGRSPRFQQALDILAGRKAIFVQQPTGFYFPGLAQTQFFDTEQFDWAAVIEAETAAIKAELEGVLAEARGEFRPYMHGDANAPRNQTNRLIDSYDWSALFLCENGKRNAAMIERCPRTWAAMQQVPAPRTVNSPTVMFSLLKPGARIAAHTGMFNTRLICHLPLIVPPGCGFRVGNEVREWQPGKLMVFDDTIEHEAWNEGGSERVVLIFDIWRPDLSEQERAEVAALFAATGAGTGSV